LTKVPIMGSFIAMSGPKKELNEYRSAITSLKRILKDRKITYRELGDGIGLTESGIKKIFAATDGSFQRLIEICGFVGVSIVEIIDDGGIKNVSYTSSQQDAFLREPELFYLYWCLVYERRSYDESTETLRLSEKKAFQLARKLDLLKLIKLLPKGRIRVPSIKAVRWKNNGEFTKTIYQNWSKSLVADLAKPLGKENEFFLLRYLQMKKSTYKEFVSAMEALEDEFVRRSIYEMKTAPNDLEHVRWLVASDNQSFLENQIIKSI
jgi:transcriptional regulator with XRE-family HTH domain